MPAFYLHVFHKERIKYEVHAESQDAVADMIDDVVSGKVGIEIEREPTNEFDLEFLVDPVNEDGSVDYENAKWYPEEYM